MYFHFLHSSLRERFDIYQLLNTLWLQALETLKSPFTSIDYIIKFEPLFFAPEFSVEDSNNCNVSVYYPHHHSFASVISQQYLFHAESNLLYDQLLPVMDSSSQVPTSVVAPMLEFANSGAPRLESTNVPNGVVLNADQRFLLYFIVGTYFGPDLKGEPHKSVFQRKAEGLPPYTLDQVAGSYMKMVEVERVYYHVLRKANRSLAVKFPLLREFFKGNLLNSGCELTANYPQFPDLFPSQMHPHSKFKNRYKIIENIVFINNLEISYLKPEEVERFKRLTRFEDLLINRDAARFHTQQHGSKLYNVPIKEAESHEEPSPTLSSHTSQRKRHMDDTMRYEEQKVHDVTHLNSRPHTGATMTNKAGHGEGIGPALVFLPSSSTKQEWDAMTAATKTGFALTGSAAFGKVGPVIGLMDIGECEDSYLFRVALTGVKRNESEFSCEVDLAGKVLIRGVTTTGEKSVYKYRQVFEMQSQNLCPSGRFSISFHLPGPVDPQQFSGHFGNDGILEGIVTKRITTSKSLTSQA